MADVNITLKIDTDSTVAPVIKIIQQNVDSAKKSTDELSKSFSGLKSPVESVTGTIKNIASSLFSLPAAAIAFAASFAGSKIVKAAEEQEDAINRLNFALASSGIFSQESSQRFQEFANTLQRTTKFSDDVILSNIALLGSLTTLNEDGLKKATTAAINLSSAAKIDLETAFRVVAKAADGNVGSLKKYGVEVSASSDKTETFAKVLTRLNNFSGAAAAELQTFSGASAQLGNSFDKVLTAFGDVIIKNPLIIKTIKVLTETFFELEDSIENNLDAIINFVNRGIQIALLAFARLIAIIELVLQPISFFYGKILEIESAIIEVVKVANELPILQNIFKGIAQASAFAATGILELVQLLLKIPGSGKVLGSFGLDLESVTEKIADLSEKTQDFVDSNNINDQISVVLTSAQNGIEKIDTLRSSAFDSISKALLGAEKSVTSFADGINTTGGAAQKAISDLPKNLKKTVETELSKEFPDLVKSIREVFGPLAKQINFKGLFKDFQFSTEGFSGALNRISTALSKNSGNIDQFFKVFGTQFEIGLANALLKGKAGAVSVFSGIASTLGTAFLGPAGAALGPIVETLAKGPEAVRALIKEFISSIPEIFTNIILAIPAAIEEIIISIADNADRIIDALILALPKFINAVILAIPEIIKAFIRDVPKITQALVASAPLFVAELVRNAPSIAVALAASMPSVALEFLKNLIPGASNFGNIFSGIVSGAAGLFSSGVFQGAVSFVGKIIEGAGQFVQELVSKIPVVGGVFGGGGGGILGGIGDIFGFAEGGLVPPGFNNDSGVFRLSSGEFVANNELTPKLEAFLDGQGNQNGGDNSGLLSRILDLLEQPMQVNSTVQFNQQAFADILINLKRSNVRTV